MRVSIKPSFAHGIVAAPPSKSMAHRLLICAGLADDESTIRHIALSEDIAATVDCLCALDADIVIDGDTLYVCGDPMVGDLKGLRFLPCRECGSTLRFFIPICLLSMGDKTLTGSEYLMTRPLTVYEELFRDKGIKLTRTADSVMVDGLLTPGTYAIPGNISSQFVSGLLFALPLLPGDSEIRLIPPVESRPYIAMTIDALRTFGVNIIEDGDTYRIPGNQRYIPQELTVEGDCSNAAFLEALNLMGGDVQVTGLNPDTLQGDHVYKILFEKIKHGKGTIDISDCPDLGPVLFAAAAVSGGAHFTGTRRLRIKESDRAEAMREELSKLGIPVTVEENSVTVGKGELHAPTGVLSAHGDHRIAMALAVLLTKVGGEIEGAECVNKSFPDFYDKLKELHVEVNCYGMDK